MPLSLTGYMFLNRRFPTILLPFPPSPSLIDNHTFITLYFDNHNPHWPDQDQINVAALTSWHHEIRHGCVGIWEITQKTKNLLFSHVSGDPIRCSRSDLFERLEGENA